MKSLTFSCLICALNLYFAQKLLKVARTAKSCSKVAEHNRERPNLGSGMPTLLRPTNDFNGNLTSSRISSLTTAGRSMRCGCSHRMLSAFKPLLGSLSNYDDDHNDDFKKTIGLMIKTTALHVHHAF